MRKTQITHPTTVTLTGLPVVSERKTQITPPTTVTLAGLPAVS